MGKSLLVAIALLLGHIKRTTSFSFPVGLVPMVSKEDWTKQAPGFVFRTLADLDQAGNVKQAETGTWESRRYLTRKDGFGFSFHHTILKAGKSTLINYKNHVEAVLVVSGSGEIELCHEGQEEGEGFVTLKLEPGTFYGLGGQERHHLRASPNADMHVACAFNPPIDGSEDHNVKGVCPAVGEDGVQRFKCSEDEVSLLFQPPASLEHGSIPVTAETKVIGEEEEGAMGIQTPPSTISIRNAHLGDGKMMWRLAQESGLDLNSPYMYNLFCRHFTDSCAVAIDEHDEVVAYLLGYKPPSTEENALFVWQIGVHPNHQRRGTALKMINWLATKMDVSYLQATVTPSNDESNALFQKFAIVNNCHSCIQDDWIAQDDFPSANKHEAESLYTIGPFELRSTGKELPLSATLCDKNHAILSDITEKESNARSYVRRFPFMVAKAEGRTLTDTSGRSYLDFLGCAGTLALGHSHPVQVEAMRKHLDDKKPLQLLDFATTAKADFMKELFTFLPEAFNDDYRIQFCGAGGSDAVDAAVKLCKIATGRKVVFAFDGAYHGMGQGTLSMMGNLGNKNVPSILSDAHFLPFPSSYRHPFGLSNTNGEGDTAVLRYIERVLDDPESGVTKPACVVLEVVQGEGGLNSFSDWALRELRRITQERDIPLVVDEIQSGFCRTGRRFAFEHSGITPDVVILSKAGGGSQPLSCIVYNKKLDVWGPGMHAGTFRGNGLAFSAGAATLKFMRSERLWQQAEQKGQLFRRLLLGAQCEYIGDVRGMGLMLGIELVNPEERGIDGLPKPSGELTAQTQTECLKRGLVIEKGGRNGSVLRPLPPLTVSEDEINRAASIILESIKAAAASIF